MLLLGVSAIAAEPGEPLSVTRLPDAERLVITAASDADAGEPIADGGEFSRAIRDSLRAQQQSGQANCQSMPTAQSSYAVRWAWEARCRYRRY